MPVAMVSNAITQYSSSTSSSHVMRTHDVLVSFRGKDTRKNFTGFLLKALLSKGVDVFISEDIRKAPDLLQAIEGSRFFVVVFSKNYASSTWCLRELAEICNCIESSPRRVLPIFYDVDPSQVRKQRGNYKKAFVKHEERFREDTEKMKELQRWREALTKVANLSGWVIQNKVESGNLELLKHQDLDFSGSLTHLSNELGNLTWYSFPMFKSLQPSFQQDKLVELVLDKRNIKQLWIESLYNLRSLDVSYSKKLIKLNLGESLNLMLLNLKGCVKLKKIHPSIGLLKKLIYVNLEYCKTLAKVPHFEETINLERLDLEGDVKLKQMNPSIGLLNKLTNLNLKDCKSLVELPHFKEDLNLKVLNLEGCIQLRQINPSIGVLRKLTFLNLKDCISLVDLPYFKDDLNLEILNLEGCIKLRQINPSIGLLRKLTFLNLNYCKSLESIPNNLCLDSLEYLSLYGCSELHYIPHTVLVGWLLPSLHQLNLSYCNLVQIPIAIGTLHFLESLILRGNNFVTLPNLNELSNLCYLNLEHCKLLEYLPELPSQSYNSFNSFLAILPSPEIEPLIWGQQPILEELWGQQPILEEAKAGLNIFNCPALVVTEECTSMHLSWMIQLVQGLYKLELGYICSEWPPRISSVIPGSEIPMWFNTQHVGISNVITIDTPPDNNCIGIACCVVFTVNSGRETDLGIFPPKPEIDYWDQHDYIIPVDLPENVVLEESDHMWLFYWAPSDFESILEFGSKGNQGFLFQVKKYGYSWIYEHDLRKDVPSSSSSCTNDVFLSFNGEDTRYTFTGNLCRALLDNGIDTFINDEELQRGDEITPAFEKTIEDSRFFIFVLSENYASSSFCLNALAHILECVKRKHLCVLPIFYKVDPSEVRYHRGSFGKALVNHEKKFKAKMEGLEHIKEKLDKWKMALHETANLPGYHFKQGDGFEYEFITRIVELVSSKINHAPLHVADYPVGLESYSEAFNYDVFLSFRASDTHHGFTGYLYKALQDSGIQTFIDEKLQGGEEIKKAIEESRIAIIVLSKDYASSTFYLDELATILDCLKRKRLLVLPVFYNVDLSQVTLQKGSYGEALAKHEEMLKNSMEKLEKWKMALHQVANLPDIKVKHGGGYDYEFIEEIVEWVPVRLILLITLLD